MALKWFVTDAGEIPAGSREHYKQTEGGFQLVLDGGHPDSTKVAEFRHRNIALIKEVDELRPFKLAAEGKGGDAINLAITRATTMEKERDAIAAKLQAFEGVDPVEYRTLKARPDVTVVEADLARERAAHAATQLRHVVTAEFLKAGGRDSAVDFMLDRAAKVFTVEGGQVASREFSPTKPGQPLTVAEWLDQQGKEADFAFKPSGGGGAGRGSASPALGAGIAKELRDPTPQQLGQHSADIASGKLKIVYT